MATDTKLVIVESPTKARKIGGYLGDGYTVLASVGHIRDLAQPSQVPASEKAKFGRFGVDVDDKFEPYYIVSPDKKKTVAELKSALKGASELFLATDEDREGEAIAWHLVQTLKPKVPVKRMVFHEITPEAIRRSLQHTRGIDDNMVNAQETRRVLDRLYGYELSPVLWHKVGPGLSAGRVQSVATRLIVERERERMAFVKAAYWDIVAQLVPLQGANHADHSSVDSINNDANSAVAQAFDARLIALNDKRIATSKDFSDDGKLQADAAQVLLLSQERAEALSEQLRHARYVVSEVESKPYRRRAQPPFTTSTLQQAAGNRLGMSSRQTMRAAQGLYENGYITYMRTDSVTLSQEAISAARQAVERRFGKAYLSPEAKQYATQTAGAQEAHECIRPAGAAFRAPEELAASVPADQLKLYTLIFQRTLACQMADAVGSTLTARMCADVAEGAALLQASGTTVSFLGFLRATSSEEQQSQLPPLSEGQELKPQAVQADGHETQPPARYTESSLVKTLEAKEIGRPSTYAAIISTIMDRGYVYERRRALIPSWLAFAVTRLLETNFAQYVDYQFTADMEHGLDQIAQGRQTRLDWLTKFYFGSDAASAHSESEALGGLHEQVAQLGDIDARAINTIVIGDGLQVRVGRYGPYVEDTQHVDAKGNPRRASIPDTLAPDELTVERAKELIATHANEPRTLGVDPRTGGTVEVRDGRFGPYVALVAPETGAAGESAQADAEAAASTKPRMASLLKSMTPESITLDDALKLLYLPREVGTYEEALPQASGADASSDADSVADAANADAASGAGSVGKAGSGAGEAGALAAPVMAQCVIAASNGRYGPYITKTVNGKVETRSLASEDEIFTVTLEQAKALFAQPKYGRAHSRAAKPPLRELGVDPESGKPVTIKDGFYGAYITDGVTNRTLPKQYAPESIAPEDAYRLLAEKRAAGSAKGARRGAARSSAARSGSTRSASSASANKSNTRKSSSRSAAKSTTKPTAKSSTKSTAKSSTTSSLRSSASKSASAKAQTATKSAATTAAKTAAARSRRSAAASKGE